LIRSIRYVAPKSTTIVDENATALGGNDKPLLS
jgi:hypothetical protein